MKKFCSFTALLIWLSGTLWAQTYTWNPAGPNTAWNNDANWNITGTSTGSGPDSNCNVVIDYTSGNIPTLTAAFSAKTVTLTDGTLNLNGNALTVSGGDFTQNGGIIHTGTSGSITVTAGKIEQTDGNIGGASATITASAGINLPETANSVPTISLQNTGATGDIRYNNNSGFMVDADNDASGGNIDISIVNTAGTLTVGTGGITADDGAITLTADNFSIGPDINAGNGKISIFNITGGRTFGLRGGGGAIFLNGELAHLKAATLEIGRTSAPLAGNITVGTGTTFDGSVKTLVLRAKNTGAGVVNAGNIAVESLAIESYDPVNFTLDSTVANVAVKTDSSTTGAINLTKSSSVGFRFNIASIEGIDGLSCGTNGRITLNAGGAVMQTAVLGPPAYSAGKITTTGGLLLTGNGPYALTASNAVNTLAANLTGSGAALSFTNNGALNVGTVGATNGIRTTGGNVTLNTTGGLNLTAAGDITGNTITLNNTGTGGVSQDTSSAITANTGLLVTGTYNTAINFAGTANKVKVFAAGTSGAAITLVNNDGANNLTIGSLTSGTTVDGITSNNRDVAITESAGAIAVNQPVNASASGDVTLEAKTGFSLAATNGNITGALITFKNTGTGGINQDTSSVITANTGLLVTGVYTAAINFAGTANKVKVFAAGTSGAAITLVNNDGANNLTIGSLTSGTTVDGITSNNRDVAITESAGTIAVNQPVNASASGDVTLKAAAGFSLAADGDITGNTITFDNTSTGGVSQDTSSAITANTGLLVTGVYTAAINFAGTANKVKVFAANTNGAAITLVNSDNVNNLTIGSLTTVSGITSNGRAVTITERTGTITVNQPVASGAAAVSVTASAAGGSISTDASPDGDITGTSITLTADAMTLSGNLDATLAGRVTVRNATAGRPIYIGAAAAVSGRLDLLNSVLSSGRLTAATLEVGRADTYASGQITIDASVNLSFVTTLVLRTGAGITNNTGSSIDVSNLAIQAGTVTSSAVTISPAPATQNIAINASGDITIGPTAGFGFNMYSYSGTTPAISGLSGHDITLDCTAGQNVTQSPGAPVTASGSLSLRRGIYKLYLSNNQAASFVGGGPLISGGILELTGNSRLAITGTITLHDGFEVNNAHATDPAFLRAGANVTVGTNVTFGGAATPPNYVTLEMIGSGSLDAASSIGHLVLTPGSTETVTLQRPLTLLGNVTIESGKTLDVSASHHKITIEGNWTQGATGSFTHRQGEVEFIGTTVSISGNTTWYKFTCTAPGASLRFSNYANAGDCHNIMPGGTFTVKGASGTPVTLTNATDSGSPTMSPAPPSPATAFWRLYLHPGATLDMENVDVKYSWAWPDPIPIPYGKNINAEYDTTWYDYNWVHLKTFVYAFTEDMDGNGRIDRIRLQSTVYLQTSAPNWWEGLAVTVMGYEKEDIPTGTFSIQGGPYTITDDSLWVYVKEKNYSDGGETPLINVANTTLRDSATGQLIDGTNGLVSTDTVAPRINYALALPGGNDVFLQASEVLAAGSLSISSPGTPSELGGGEFLITGASPGGFSLTELASGSTTFTVIGGSDTASPPGVIPSQVEGVLPKLPVAYSSSHPGYAYYDGTNYTIAYSNSAGLPFPNSFNPPISHRVTDVLISIPPVSPSDPWYFVWPIWAKYLSPPNDSGFPADGAAWTGGGAQATDTGIIWDFTGRKALEERDTTLQVLRNSALSGDPKLVFAFNVPREYRNPPEYNTGALGSSGLWLPGSIASFINLVPRYYSLPSGSPLSHNSNPLSDYYIYQFDKDDPGYDSPSRLDFLFSLPVSPADLFAARLDTAASGPWYRRVRPFSYDIHDTTLQRGGVTILNNVINSNKGETVFIRYHLVNSGRVTVQVFTLDGTLIKTLRRENRSAGEWTESWNGSNNSGRPVARGLYFIRVVAPDIDEIRKVMVVK